MSTIASKSLNKEFHLTWGTLLFIIIHLSCLLVFVVPVDTTGIIMLISLFLIRTFSITAGYHRYFAHRSFKTNRLFQFCLAFIGGTCGQKGVLWWVAHHRHHHKHSDTENDIHSAKQEGFYWSHIGWMISREYHAAYNPKLVKDLEKYPELVWLDKFHLFPPLILAVACFAFHGWIGLVWGFLLSTVALYHNTFSVNSVCHMFGRKDFQTGESSRNNWLLALPTLGESWHNNHHRFPMSARSGLKWWQVDITFAVLKILSWLKIVRAIKVVDQNKSR